ncbi:MAG: diacylglycerol kinase family protein [Candidatus Gastranaerophilales bacterium]|nr:diacylglycerol kinase family protein [Candidatus Gastranaerophilales bacterium]
MSKYSEKQFLKSFSFALRGLRIGFKSQKNIRRQCCVAVLVFVCAYFLHFSLYEYLFLVIAVAMVLTAEMFNSAIEFSIDAVLKNKYSKLAGMAKDVAAGAVCITSFTAVIIGSLLFLNKILPLVKGYFV